MKDKRNKQKGKKCQDNKGKTKKPKSKKKGQSKTNVDYIKQLFWAP